MQNSTELAKQCRSAQFVVVAATISLAVAHWLSTHPKPDLATQQANSIIELCELSRDHFEIWLNNTAEPPHPASISSHWILDPSPDWDFESHMSVSSFRAQWDTLSHNRQACYLKLLDNEAMGFLQDGTEVDPVAFAELGAGYVLVGLGFDKDRQATAFFANEENWDAPKRYARYSRVCSDGTRFVSKYLREQFQAGWTRVPSFQEAFPELAEVLDGLESTSLTELSKLLSQIQEADARGIELSGVPIPADAITTLGPAGLCFTQLILLLRASMLAYAARTRDPVWSFAWLPMHRPRELTNHKIAFLFTLYFPCVVIFMLRLEDNMHYGDWCILALAVGISVVLAWRTQVELGRLCAKAP